MYLEHFGFDCEPFNITPDSKFLFASTRHREAMAALLYGIEQRKGFIALTGEVGSGKTTICRALLKELNRERIRLALVLNPQLNDLELLQAINAEFGLPHTSSSKRELLDELNKFLLEEYAKGHNCVLVIDESQRLSFEALEQVRLISNLELESTKLIQIALVGQPELDEMLHRPELEQLNQRIMVRYHIEPLDLEETRQYIEHRLHVANPNTPAKFNSRAVKAIFDYSRGVPRKINVTADRALLVAYVEEKHEVSGTMAQKAIDEVCGRRPGHRASASTPAPVHLVEVSVEEEREQPERHTPEPAPTVGEAGGFRALAIAVVLGCAILASAYMMNNRGRENVVAASQPPVEPTPDILIAATPELTPTPAPTPIETPVPVEMPTPTPTATPLPVEPTPVAVADAPSSETIEVVQPWTYDKEGILRVETPEVTYVAAVFSWISHQLDQKLSDEDLQALGSMDVAELAELEIASGPPLYLRLASLPPSIEMVTADRLPMLAQVDQRAADFGPWTVIIARGDGALTLHDPQRGVVQVTEEEFEDSLAALIAPYQDELGITGLGPGDSGPQVDALQQLLAAARAYQGNPSGIFDAATEQALAGFRRMNELTGPPQVDELTAMELLR